MKLARVHVTEFQSVRDSGAFEIGDITCLVGKNESGKTAILQALYRLNPFIDAQGQMKMLPFLAHVALRPNLWGSLLALGRNSSAGAKAIAESVERFLVEKDVAGANGTGAV